MTRSPCLALPDLGSPSPFRSPRQASGRYDSWMIDSIPRYSPKTVEPGPHVPSYLYMAAKPECVSLCIELFNGMHGSTNRFRESVTTCGRGR
jgi:hypothetical protein